jgi:hypothetical protein
MQPSQIDILDWGKPETPMAIMRDGVALRLDVPDGPVTWHAECAAYAAIDAPASTDAEPAGKTMDLGFYGYLRLCNALCLEMAGVSIFDLADAPWRDWYDGRKPPTEAVTIVMADNHTS